MNWPMPAPGLRRLPPLRRGRLRGDRVQRFAHALIGFAGRLFQAPRDRKSVV
jgi:hypothetical protein